MRQPLEEIHLIWTPISESIDGRCHEFETAQNACAHIVARGTLAFVKYCELIDKESEKRDQEVKYGFANEMSI